MQTRPCSSPILLLAVVAFSVAHSDSGQAQAAQAQTAPSQTASSPIGHTSARDLQVAGAVSVHNGEMQLGNGSTVTAADQPVTIALNRGGQLRLCSTTSVHLSHDRSVDAPDSTALMLALDRGAIEARYTVGKYSDVLLTPDLRVLISGPGVADLSIRVNGKGDTCVDNRGPNAPYITITSQLEGGLYRVQPNQHVSFQHGSLREVVDTETEPCGCPAVPPTSLAGAGQPPGTPSHAVGGPSSTAADTAFPLALSEGLATPPPQPATPVAAPGEVHAQVVVPLTFNGSAPPPKELEAPVPDLPTPRSITPAKPVAATPASSASTPVPPQPAAPAQSVAAHGSPTNSVAQTPTPALVRPAPKPAASPAKNLLRKVGRFFSRVFGAE